MLCIQFNQPKPTTFGQRLAQEARRVKERAKTLPQGKEREPISQGRATRDRLAHQRVAVVSRAPATEVERHFMNTTTQVNPAVIFRFWVMSSAIHDSMNSVYDAWIDKANPPARACIEARLADPDLRIEITAIAAIRNA